MSRIRPVLLKNLDLWVNPAGSDDNDGMLPTAAFATLQAAVNAAALYDTGLYAITINTIGSLAGAELKNYVGQGEITIQGDATTAPTITSSIQAVNVSSTWNIAGCTFTCSTVPGIVCDGSRINLGTSNIFRIAGTLTTLIEVSNQGVLNCEADQAIAWVSGTAQSWLYVYDGGVADLQARNFVVTGTAFAWGSAGALARNGGRINAVGATSTSDTSTGPDALADLGGTVWIDSNTNLPGSTAPISAAPGFIGSVGVNGSSTKFSCPVTVPSGSFTTTPGTPGFSCDADIKGGSHTLAAPAKFTIDPETRLVTLTSTVVGASVQLVNTGIASFNVTAVTSGTVGAATVVRPTPPTTVPVGGIYTFYVQRVAAGSSVITITLENTLETVDHFVIVAVTS